MLALTGQAQTPLEFAPPVAYEIGDSLPLAHVAADFDQDGHLDLAVTGEGQFHFLLGDGTGALLKDNSVAFPNADRLAAGDFNGDGALDIAVTQGTQTTPGACNGAIAVGIFLGAPRSTQMTQKGCLDAGSYPHGIQAADFTGDGLVDLAVVSNVAHGLKLFPGAGDGTFGAAITAPESAIWATSMAPPVDLNLDGHLDLVIAHYSGVSAFLGHGDGSFSLAAGGAGSGFITEAAVTGDLNEDGILDVASVEEYNNRLIVSFGNGDGTFMAGPQYTIGSFLEDLAVADLDHDGHLDIAVASQDGASVPMFLGHGDGTFTAAAPLAIGAQPRLVAVRDWDEDGDLDLAVPDRNYGDIAIVWVALQVGDGGRDSTPPAVSVVSPVNRGTIAGRVALRAVASDDVGVVQVEFYRNRTPIAVSGGPDFLATWNTAGKPNGWYLLTARAVDAAGNSKRSAVAVRVAN